MMTIEDCSVWSDLQPACLTGMKRGFYRVSRKTAEGFVSLGSLLLRNAGIVVSVSATIPSRTLNAIPMVALDKRPGAPGDEDP